MLIYRTFVKLVRRTTAVILASLAIASSVAAQGLIDPDQILAEAAPTDPLPPADGGIDIAIASMEDEQRDIDPIRLVDYQERISRRIDRYMELDFLLFWAGDSTLPPLLTTNPNGTPLADVGLLGGATTTVLNGNQTVGNGLQGGFRLRLGRYFRGKLASRIELGLWMLLPDSESFGYSSTGGDPILARPFFNPDPAVLAQDSQIISYPGVANGSFRSTYNRQAVGFDPTIFTCLYGSSCSWLEAFSGYRFLWLKDELKLHEEVSPEPGGLIAPGTRYVIDDEFRAENTYNLIPLGLSYSRNRGKWNINTRGSVGIGIVKKTVSIRGQTDSYIGDTLIDSEPGGFLALGTNSGVHNTTQFAVVPQFDLTARYSLSDQLSANVGYTLMYLDDAVKAVDHVPTAIDPGNLPPADPAAGPDPRFAFAFDDIVLHGLTFGLRFDF